jgi:cytoskeletal protein RodZ
VTESSQRKSSVRRTVLIAVSLVVGQLALCSVIGWVTFGGLLGPPKSADRPIADQPSSAAPAIPSIPAPPSPSATPSTEVKPTKTRSGSKRSDATQAPVQAKATCSPENATGRTDADEPVRCLRTDNDELRWKLA